MSEIKLENWINPVYVEAFRRGSLEEFRQESPFRHAVLQNFLKKEILDDVLKHCENIRVDPSHRQGIAEKTDWYWGAFSHLDYIRFFLSQNMRRFLNALIGEKLILKKKLVPQFNIFRPESPGLPVHTDMAENVGIVTLMQLSHGYSPGFGGELVFYKKDSGGLIKDRIIEPICNTLIVFQVSDKSFHGVEDMSGNWTRRTITYDWLYEGQAAPIRQSL